MPTLKKKKGGLNSFGNKVKQNISRRIVTPFVSGVSNVVSKFIPKFRKKINSRLSNYHTKSPTKSPIKYPNCAPILEKCNSEKADLESYNEACHKTTEQLKATHNKYKALAIEQIDNLRSKFNKLKRVTKRTYANKSNTHSNHSTINNEMAKLKEENEGLKLDRIYLSKVNAQLVETISKLRGDA